ncbi:MAG: TetR/AcrR family transcriptional regulator [Myxococcota bacterium]
MRKTPAPLQWIRPPRQARTQKSLERFLDAAEGLLLDKSFEDVHVADVAQRAGSSVPAFYRRFRDKNALLHALHERKCEEALATADAALNPERWEGANIREILASSFRCLVEILKQHESLERAVHQRALSDGTLWERAIRVRRHVMDGLSELLLDRREEIGHPKPALAVSFALVQAMALLTEYYTVGLRDIQRSAMSDRQVVNELLSSCLAYLQWQEV